MQCPQSYRNGNVQTGDITKPRHKVDGHKIIQYCGLEKNTMTPTWYCLSMLDVWLYKLKLNIKLMCNESSVNPFPPSVGYMRQSTVSALVQVMAWRRTGDKLLPWTLLIGPLGTHFTEMLNKIQTFHLRNCLWKDRLRNGWYIVQVETI